MTASVEPGTGASPLGRPAETPRQEGRRAAKSAGEKAAQLSSKGKATATSYMRELSDAVDTTRHTLEEQGHGYSAQLLDRLAEEVRGFAGRLEGKSGAEMFREVESFAHRRPGLFIGGALLAGFGLSRFLKSTDQPSGGGSMDPSREHDTPISNR